MIIVTMMYVRMILPSAQTHHTTYCPPQQGMSWTCHSPATHPSSHNHDHPVGILCRYAIAAGIYGRTATGSPASSLTIYTCRIYAPSTLPPPLHDATDNQSYADCKPQQTANQMPPPLRSESLEWCFHVSSLSHTNSTTPIRITPHSANAIVMLPIIMSRVSGEDSTPQISKPVNGLVINNAPIVFLIRRFMLPPIGVGARVCCR